MASFPRYVVKLRIHDIRHPDTRACVASSRELGWLPRSGPSLDSLILRSFNSDEYQLLESLFLSVNQCL